jgi:cobalt transporter subunit CbtB
MASLPSVAKRLGFRQHITRSSSTTMAPLYAAVLGLVLVYGAGLAQTEEIHNGAHDTRHSAGFPCH